MTLVKIALKNITSRPGRFLLTSLAVLVGVALTTSVFVLTDSLRDTFGDLSDDIESGYDIAVRSEVPFGDRLTAAPVPVEARSRPASYNDPSAQHSNTPRHAVVIVGACRSVRSTIDRVLPSHRVNSSSWSPRRSSKYQ